MVPQRLFIEAWSLIGDSNHCEAVMKTLIHWVRHNLIVWYRGDGDFERWGLVVGRKSLGMTLGPLSLTGYYEVSGSFLPHPLYHDDLPYHKLKAAKPAGNKLQPLRPWAKVGCCSSLSQCWKSEYRGYLSCVWILESDPHLLYSWSSYLTVSEVSINTAW